MLTVRVPAPAGPLLSARLAVCLAFFILGSGAGLWAVFIPVVRARLDINEGILGLALLAIAIGSLLSMPPTGWAIARFGAHRISALAAVAMPVSASLPILAPNTPLLFLASLVFGACSGVLDVAMNNEAARVETAYGRPLMSSFHGLFSVGGLAGAGVAALLVGFADPASAWSAFGVLVLLAVAAFLVRAWYLPDMSHRAGGVRFTLPSRSLLALGLLAFLAFGLEGAVADWSALFLEGEKQATPALAATGYAAFAGAMAIMRFLGDRLVARFGRARTLMFGGIGIAGGCVLALLAPWPVLSAVGFGIMGIGAANVVPVLFSTAAQFPPGSGRVSAVATIGYFGTLSWPPVIGGIAHGIGLPTALWLIALAGIVIALRSGLVRHTEKPTGAADIPQ